MTLFQNQYRVESNRMRGFDYSSVGAYFITICTHKREYLFGEIFDGQMVLNPLGKQIHQCWTDIPQHFPFVTIDEFVVIPNRVHGIIIINENPNPFPSPSPAPFRSPSKTVGSIVRGFKIGLTKWARQNSHIHDIWQPNYHDRIIKTERALNAIRNYIRNNPIFGRNQ